MYRHTPHDNATSNVLAWSQHAANIESAADDDAAPDADEPPEPSMQTPNIMPEFRRSSVVHKPKETHASLLTRALQSADEGHMPASTSSQRNTASLRRRSITSDISVTSIADLTSDTGMSTPARTNSPSPRLVDMGFAPLATDKHHGAPVQIMGSLPRRDFTTYLVRKPDHHPTPAVASETKDPAVQPVQKKRCISFACTAKPKADAAKAPIPAPAPAPTEAPVQATSAGPSQPAQTKKPCIKFACPAKPSHQNIQQTPPKRDHLAVSKVEDSGSVSTVVSTPATIRTARSPVARRARPMTPRKLPLSPAPVLRKKKYITASSDELQSEEYHFHAFAGAHSAQDDWIREDGSARKGKLFIDDLLKKENDFRRLAKEAEEEAEQEEAEDDDGEENDDEDDDEENNVDDEDELEENEDEDDEGNLSGYGTDDDFSDGYNTDEDLGFADSDDEEHDDLCLWTLTASQSYIATFSNFRPSSFGGMSDSSACSRRVNVVRTKRSRQPTVARPMTPELPDSTDFVCGTMDEDRPLEEAYATRIAARKLEKLRAIPQDIDPSFPTSDHEDDDDDDDDAVHHSHESGEPLWLHGEIEELHDERAGRRQRKCDVSPKRHRSPPPPKRYHSPPPKARGRSPRRLFDHASPKRVKSPAPVAHIKSPAASLIHPGPGHALAFKSLAARPGLTHTKSLPRASYFPAHIKSCKRSKAGKDTAHVRGAIDIVKGLEQKRQRRKEKFHQKYCDRARKGQVPEKKKARVGEGAERMRELGLLSAGKRNYVISV